MLFREHLYVSSDIQLCMHGTLRLLSALRAFFATFLWRVYVVAKQKQTWYASCLVQLLT